MRSRLKPEIVSLLTDTSSDTASLLHALREIRPVGQAMIEARFVVRKAMAEHSAALYRLRYRESLITEEALRLLEQRDEEETT